MDVNLLEITRELLGVANISFNTELNLPHNLALIKEFIGVSKRLLLNEPETLSQDIIEEYYPLFNLVKYQILNLKIEQIEVIDIVFQNIFMIVTTGLTREEKDRCDELESKNTTDPAEIAQKRVCATKNEEQQRCDELKAEDIEDLDCLNTKEKIVPELMARIGEKIRNAYSSARTSGRASSGSGASASGASGASGASSGSSYGTSGDPHSASYGNYSSHGGSYGAGDGSSSHVDQNGMSRFLTTPAINNVATYFGNLDQEVRDRVHNVGAPVKNFMTDIIRPNPVSERNCLKDRRFPREPVEVLSQGTPAGAYEFQGVGTMLPKFAYTEVQNDNYY
jgi:hypothetical protein